MSKEPKELEVPANVTRVDSPAAPTMETLLKMFIEESRESRKVQEKLSEAILESRKPYVDPRYLAELETRRKDRLALVNQTLRQKLVAKKACPHRNEGGKLNIKWMMHSNHIIRGVCGTCFSQFDATADPEDAKLFREDLKSQRNMGRAGEHAVKGVDIAIA